MALKFPHFYFDVSPAVGLSIGLDLDPIDSTCGSPTGKNLLMVPHIDRIVFICGSRTVESCCEEPKIAIFQRSFHSSRLFLTHFQSDLKIECLSRVGYLGLDSLGITNT